MEKTRIQIIGDSLSLHRESEGISYEDTYPYILSKKYDIELSSKYSKTSSDAFIIKSGMKYIIIHIGIVDCFPRVYAKNTKLILFYLPSQLRNLITFFHRHYRYYFTRMFPKVTTSKENFENNIRCIIYNILESGATPILIDIVNVSPEVERRNYGANDNIEKYNDVLRKLSFQYNCQRVRLNGMTKHYKNMLHTDGQHLSKIGHLILAKMIIGTIELME